MTSVTHEKPVPVQETGSYRSTILWWIGALLLLIAIYFGWRLANGLPLIGPPQLHGFVMENPAPIGNFTLTAHTGESVSLSDFRGQITLIYFGYAYCPDVCPATMSELAKARAAFSTEDQEEIQVLMVTVDPARDSPELLESYLGHFDPTFLGLTGSDDEIAGAAATLGIFHEKRLDDGDPDYYFIDHTATVALIDRRGYLRMVWPFGVRGEEMTADLRYFLRERSS